MPSRYQQSQLLLSRRTSLCPASSQTLKIFSIMAPVWLHSASVLVLLVMSWPCSRAYSSKHLCGPNLVEALSMVCGDRGFFTSSKRDIDSVLRIIPPKTDEATSTDDINEIVGYAFQKKMDMMMKRDGIVEQCCHQPCSMLVLDKYCN